MKTEGQGASRLYRLKTEIEVLKKSCGGKCPQTVSPLTTKSNDSRSQSLSSLGLLAQVRASGEETQAPGEGMSAGFSKSTGH